MSTFSLPPIIQSSFSQVHQKKMEFRVAGIAKNIRANLQTEHNLRSGQRQKREFVEQEKRLRQEKRAAQIQVLLQKLPGYELARRTLENWKAVLAVSLLASTLSVTLLESVKQTREHGQLIEDVRTVLNTEYREALDQICADATFDGEGTVSDTARNQGLSINVASEGVEHEGALLVPFTVKVACEHPNQDVKRVPHLIFKRSLSNPSEHAIYVE